MDEIDRAQARDEQDREAAVAAARRSRPGLAYTGCCHWCGDITGGGRRFCDADCRDDYDRAARARAMRGER